jgi:hypothetical protein
MTTLLQDTPCNFIASETLFSIHLDGYEIRKYSTIHDIMFVMNKKKHLAFFRLFLKNGTGRVVLTECFHRYRVRCRGLLVVCGQIFPNRYRELFF